MKTKKRYSKEFKAQALELVALGKPVTEVAQDLHLSRDLVYRWRSDAAKLAQGESGGQRAVGEMAEADELRQLCREVAHLRMENDILKKAAVIIGTNHQLKSDS